MKETETFLVDTIGKLFGTVIENLAGFYTGN